MVLLVDTNIILDVLLNGNYVKQNRQRDIFRL